jgi:hypothetical protein
VPSLFRRRTAELVDDPAPTGKGTTETPNAGTDTAATGTAGTTAAEPDSGEAAGAAGDGMSARARPARGYTPSKRELGQITPKRPSAHVRRQGGPPPRSRKDLTKEERRELKEARRQRRREVSEGIRRGDPRYLPARDRGPERALARDVVDSRRTAGTWFFGGALVILLASSSAIPVVVMVANAMFLLLTTALAVDSVVICRRLGKLIRERHPDSTQGKPGLYFYAVMRSVTFRRMRIPQPRVSIGDRV